MYTGHFGLDDGPFHGKAEGQEVYVGPQQAAVIARLRKVLGIADTAVTVSGPVGVGKTTLVRRALADLPGRKTIIPVDRMRLEPDEVLDLLLSRFDVTRPPKGTIQRFAAFRRLLHERLADDIRVFIVVEDAERVGVDALLELEALTATDSGESVGANIVLLGGDGLSGMLAKPALARLRQRVRLRQAVAPFDEAEVEGYMRHCLESAGGVLEQIFEPGTTRIAYRYSGGIARVVDTLCESALVAAAETGLATILPEFLQEVAENCGLEPQVTEADAAEPVSAPEVESAADATAGHDLECESSAPPFAPPRLALVAPPPGIDVTDSEAGEDQPEPPAPLPEVSRKSEPSSPFPDEAPEDAGETEIAMQPADEWRSHGANVTVSRIDKVLPELIERLQSQARSGVQTTAETVQQLDRSSDDSAELPTLSNSMRAAVLPLAPPEEQPHTAGDVVANESVGEDVDEDTDEYAEQSTNEFPNASACEETTGAATLSLDEAQALAPDAATDVLVPGASDQVAGAGEPELDALQAAIQAVNAWQASEVDVDAESEPQASPQASEADLPEITLDAELEKKEPASNDLDRWADELSQAKSLEDISDILAETLFGNEEVEAISAGFRAGKAAGPGEADAGPTATPDPASRAPQSVAPQVPRPSVARQPSAVAGPRPQPKAPVRPPVRPIAAKPKAGKPIAGKPMASNRTASNPGNARAGHPINMTMSQRIEMVNSLKGRKPLRPVPGMRVAEIILGEQPDEPLPPAANGPQPIEAQIETAITQSRKVLSDADLVRLASSHGDDHERNGGGNDDKGRRGLFGLFRRSSKT